MDGEGQNHQSRGQALLELRRRAVPTSLGIDLPVHAIEPGELVLISRTLLDLAAMGEARNAAAAQGGDGGPEAAAKAFTDYITSPKGKEFFALVERVVRAGCLDPVFGTDPAAGPVVSDLPLVDQLAVFNAVLELSGYSKQAAESIRPS